VSVTSKCSNSSPDSLPHIARSNLLGQVETQANILTGYYPDLNVPNVSATLVEARKAQTSLDDALENVKSGKKSASEAVKTQLEGSLKAELNGSKTTISALLCDTSTDLMTKQSDLQEVHDKLSNMRLETAERENTIVSLFCCFTFFGAVLPFFLASMGVLGKGKRCRTLGGGIVWLLIPAVCIIMGLSQVQHAHVTLML
jgi:hypothetical protein